MSDRFVRTTTLFGKQYDWRSVDGVLTLLPHVHRTTTLFGKQYDWRSVDGVLTLLPHVHVPVLDLCTCKDSAVRFGVSR